MHDIEDKIVTVTVAAVEPESAESDTPNVGPQHHPIIVKEPLQHLRSTIVGVGVTEGTNDADAEIIFAWF